MRLVIDTSVLVAVARGEPERARLLELSESQELIAPSVLPYEIGNALIGLCRRRLISAEEALELWRSMALATIQLRSVQVVEALKLALAAHIYAYDAYFLQCAREARCPILTLDRRMRSLAAELNLRVLE
jgi:predicted nucleic acid-binding protein